MNQNARDRYFTDVEKNFWRTSRDFKQLDTKLKKGNFNPLSNRKREVYRKENNPDYNTYTT